jgi:geranylgeranyl reductase
VVPGNPLDDAKLLVNTIGSIVRSTAMRQAGKAQVNM